MRNPWSGGFTDKAEWQFKTCARNDGSYYGTADGNKCRIGTEASLPDKAEKVKKLLNMGSAEFESTYGKVRDDAMAAHADELAAKINGSKLSSLSVDDARRAFAAKRLTQTLNDIDELKNEGPEGAKMAKSIASTKEFFDDMKWRLVNDRLLVSEGTLDLAWEGQNLGAKANAAFNSKEFGQSRVVVAEHPVPSKSLKTNLLNSKDRTVEGVTRTALKNNFLSLTSAKEDNKLNASYKSSMPDPKVAMSRYKKAEVKTFLLNKETTLKTVPTPDAASKKLSKSAAEAKEKKMSKEEWIASIIEGMENM